jgi:hypothetical protein
MSLNDTSQIELALQRTGELLQARGIRFQIVAIGGAAMNLLGFVTRATTDVDILAFGKVEGVTGHTIIQPPEPLPEPLRAAARAVARQMNLRPDRLNAGPAGRWKTGLPPGLESRIVWRTYAALEVGLASRLDLIYLKLYAAADDTGPGSVHFQDLLALSSSDEELADARRWVVSQDPGTEAACTEIIAHVNRAR